MYELVFTSSRVNPNKAEWGWNPPAPISMTCYVDYDDIIDIKHQCKFLFWCFKPLRWGNKRGSIIFFLKILVPKKKNSSELKQKS